MPDSPNLSSAVGEAVEQGRQFLATVESLGAALSAELARWGQAEKQWAIERQALTAEIGRAEHERDQAARQRQEEAGQFKSRITQLEGELAAARERHEAVAQDVRRLQAEVSAGVAETARLRDQMALVGKERDGLQAEQVRWGLEREQAQGELNRLKAALDGIEAELATDRERHAELRTRYDEASQRSEKLAADWAARRQALAAEIAAQNEEMEQVRHALQESQEHERKLAGAPPPAIVHGGGSLTSEQIHLINSRLNALIGFSSVLLDERGHPITVEERREYLNYLHESALRLTETIRSLTGPRLAAEPHAPVVDKDRRPPDILVADNDAESRQRIEPFLKRAGYEVVYVDNANRALEKASNLQPLAILIDGKLPPNGAPTLVRELRRDPRTRDIPIVLLSGVDSPPMAIAECEVLTKPVDRQQLVQLMVRFDLMADSKKARKMPANVLVIDDDPQATSLVKAILKPFNVRVSAVDSGRAGIEHALRNKPDLVILDLMMPKGDGFEVVEALRRDKDVGRVPILIHTAKTLTAEDRVRLEGKVESIVEKAQFQPERFLELLLKRGERRKHAA